MRAVPRHAIVGLLLMLVSSLVPARAEDDAEALARLRREIDKTVGDARCTAANFCRVLPMGYDACGNPTAWIAYNNGPDLKEILETKASEVTFIEEERQRGKPRPADCRPARIMKPACINNRCVAGDLSY